ncbi:MULTISPECIES: sigma-70 family RNA polymerase sigma factor [Butyricimonas]|uniref:Sigma-70 family RNA polymerase sigma factor n=1 Tax=Butyricimonas hominis TaxID=2763032 RepID=A0ABR7D4Y6_9BACT|nr:MULTISPECIES: sigma-70 family RNA polymerase sigma factor [Butyricimonas]MBC5623002.1 sigma-70 family RNA polymerase sigma factor [Butyricimonas hominis]MCB6971783.1 sigma-70 family RNA polymerase sigma factor [Butyricimonas synergistica]MCG4518609.1 sigma-70 family RNA polymerase sigma factor [Butyricimonas sp. DFI.6.44]
MRKDDRDILDRFTKNRKDGIRVLFDRYYRPLVLYAGTLISDDTMAEDLVQEFFVRLWEDDYLERIESKALSSYLFSSVRNSCYTYLHKNDVMRARVDFTSIDVAADSAAALSQEIVDRVTAVIARMPEQTGRVLNCVLMQDMKYQETADELHVSLNTVKTLLRNGMRLLREELQSEQELILLFVCAGNSES